MSNEQTITELFKSPTYVLMYPNGGYLRVDHTSGYPDEVKTIRRAKLWTEKNGALEYQRMFKDKGVELFQLVSIETSMIKLEANKVDG